MEATSSKRQFSKDDLIMEYWNQHVLRHALRSKWRRLITFIIPHAASINTDTLMVICVFIHLFVEF